MKKTLLKGLDPESILHEDDKAVKKKLDATPGFKSFMTKVVCPFREKMIDIEYLGNGLHVTADTLPALHELLLDVCNTLDVEIIPSLSMIWHYAATAATEGAQNPHITTLSGAIDLLSDEELSFLFGHELGHQMCGHKPYHMFLECLFLPAIGAIPGAKKWISLVRTTLLHWYRISDFTADRIGLLACQDINVALKVLVKLSGIPIKYHNTINVESFIRQAQEFDDMFNSMIGEGIKYLALNAESHPWMVVRAAELLKWYQSGEYEGIINSQNK
jgi:hypothetical protein